MGGEELQVIKENDMKSSKMSLVCTMAALLKHNADMIFLAHQLPLYNENV